MDRDSGSSDAKTSLDGPDQRHGNDVMTAASVSGCAARIRSTPEPLVPMLLFFIFSNGLRHHLMISPDKALVQIKKPPKGGFFWFWLSALGKLLAAPCLVKAHFLALDFPRVPGNQSCLAQNRLERRIVIDQCTRDAVPDGARLA